MVNHLIGRASMHHYHKLQELLNAHPVGAPKSEEFIEILKILFQPGEV
jgi:hypothetical protein